MRKLYMSAAVAAAILVVLATSPSSPNTVVSEVRAADAAWRLEAVEKTLPVGGETTLAVRLIQASSGKPVANVVVFRARLDMAPDGMGDMAAPLTPAASSDPTIYRFTTTLNMAGRWLLAVQAKVPGVTETVHAETIVTGVEQPTGAAPPHHH
jgi:hypothetical protein